jgi:hypothetical protein
MPVSEPPGPQALASAGNEARANWATPKASCGSTPRTLVWLAPLPIWPFRNGWK